ncbi:hypothetical protein H696_02544 [Fonticula alba]|uniref:R-spondin Fu-CRD domain-containing protein n=1 Tax=Fonticula alba TaxID=691883 RepID=A0A058ZCD1_FONAL|nr:hypothetical protein H696_02544 [Fonticula alba]KCV71601.1 hypothetical protein H696_02544 [Fonticula alba]|eukprot:XP_009494724.1 hypothetical protein H696_02544 [Fonticula alba]
MRSKAPRLRPSRTALLGLVLLLGLVASILGAVRAADCAEGFFSSPTGSCLPCNVSCSTCTRAESCLTCLPGLVFLSSDPNVESLCSHTCLPGDYRSILNRCLPCDPSCRDCSDNYQKCYNCSANHGWADTHFIGGSGEVSTCSRCSKNCVSCSRSSGFFVCHACTAGFALDPLGDCMAVDEPGFWKDSTSQRFLSCAPTCRTCTGPSANECLSCVGDLSLELQPGRAVGHCVSSCPAGKVPIPEVPGLCVSCHYSCGQCFGLAQDQCWACQPGRVLLGTECVSTCPDGYYATEGRCERCHVSCDRCTGPSNTQCLGQCSAGLLSLDVPTGGGGGGGGSSRACVTQCPAGTTVWPDGSCSRCSANCATCHYLEGASAATDVPCAKRTHPFHLPSGCYERCPAGSYASGEDCLPCDSTCRECSGPGPAKCTNCWHDNVLTMDGKCMGSCPGGYFVQTRGPQDSAACQPCSAMCSSCLREDWCMACQEDAFLVKGSCLAEGCPQGWTICPDSNECIACDENCLQCEGHSDNWQGTCQQRCTKCAEPLVFFPEEGLCIEKCSPSGIPAYVRKGECVACQENCRTCHEKVSMCTSCRDADQWLMVDTGECKDACPNSGFAGVDSRIIGDHDTSKMCFTCPENCDKCSDWSWQDNSHSSGYTSESSDSYERRTLCAISHEDGSLKCPWRFECDRCKSPLVLMPKDRTCVSECPVGTFVGYSPYDPNARACIDCQPGCLECTGNTHWECTRYEKSGASRSLAIGLGVGLGILGLLIVGGLVAGFLVLRARKSAASKESISMSVIRD